MHHDTGITPALPTAPQSEAEVLGWIRLIRSPRVGPVTFHRLLGEHGKADAALAALPGIAEAAGAKDYAPCPIETAKAELAAARKAGAQFLAFGAPTYPASLYDLSDAPPFLWAFGDVSLAHKPAIGLVGARNASALGQRMARSLAKGLGQMDVVIVSGLARGIDKAAHDAALDSGTIAILAGGVDVPYPAENTDLARAIFRKGLLLSERPMGMMPQARDFPRRNRLISGLSRGVIVVEAAAKSGSLITARNALDQGREVMAVPAHPFDTRAAGANQLIRDGAVLVRNADDVLAALGPSDTPNADDARPKKDAPSRANAAPQTNDLQSALIGALSADPIAEDALAATLNAPADKVAMHLTELELDGRVIRHGGGLVSRTP